MFVIRYNATDAGLRKVGVVNMGDPVAKNVDDILTIMDRYLPLAHNDSIWIPPCCWADHE